MHTATNFTNHSPRLGKWKNCLTAGNRTLIALLSFLFFSFTAFAQIGSGTAPVNPPSGGFSINGDVKAGLTVGDWLEGAGGGFVLDNTLAGAPVNTSTTFHLYDKFNSGSDDNFKAGLKFDGNPNGWSWVSNPVNAKQDINNGLIHFTRGTDGKNHQWVIVGADRFSNNGDAYIDFEFLQNPLTLTTDATGTGGKFVSAGPNGGRTAKDFVVTLSLTRGGSSAGFFFNRWESVPVSSQAPAGFDYVDRSSSIPAGSVLAAVNKSALTGITYRPFNGTTYDVNTFAEAAIDLTALLDAVEPCSQLNIQTILIKTKESQSPTATIVDFVAPKQVSLEIGDADAGPDQILCPGGGGTTDFQLAGNASANTGTVTSATWSVKSGAATFGAGNTATSTNLSDVAHVTQSPTTLTLTVVTSDGCMVTDDVILSVKTLTKPTLTIKDNCDGTSTLTVTDYTGTLNWADDATNHSDQRTVSVAMTYNVTQTVNGCPSDPASGAANPKSAPGKPTVNVTDNCDGTSTLTATNYVAGNSLLWSTGETTPSITVTVADTYTVSQQDLNTTCTSDPGSGTANPKTAPAKPSVGVKDNCDGTSTLTASDYIGNLLWSTGETTVSISVTDTKTYTVTQTVNGCTSDPASASGNPKTAPADPTGSDQTECANDQTLTASAMSTTNGAIITWYDAPKGGNVVSSPTLSYVGTITYYAEASLNGCSSNRTPIKLTINATPDAPTLGGNDPTCAVSTGSITVTSATTGLKFKLDNGIFDDYPSGGWTGLLAGSNHTVTAKNSDGCPSGDATRTIGNALTTPQPSVTPKNPDCLSSTGSVTVTSPLDNGVNDYQYRNNGGTWQESPVFSGLAAGSNYSITAQLKGGCESAAATGKIGQQVACNGHIFETGTTCSDYTQGLKQQISACYTAAPGKKPGSYQISNATPGVFFYYTNLKAPNASFTVTVTQTNTANWAGFATQKDQIIVYNLGCVRVTKVTMINTDAFGNVTFLVSGVTAGEELIMSVKYDMKSIITQTLASANQPSDYTFVTSINGTSDPNTSGTLKVVNCKPVLTTSVLVGARTIVDQSVVSKLAVSAYPNPFTDKIRFTIQAPKAGRATLEVYNMLGQKVGVPFEGSLNANETRNVEYTAPANYRSSLIYRLRMNGEQVSGKLMNVKQ